MEISNTIKHNISKASKTGGWRSMRPEVDEEKCNGCGICVKFCPEACMELKEKQRPSEGKKNNKVVEVDYEWCKGCGVCANVCPVKAILMKKE